VNDDAVLPEPLDHGADLRRVRRPVRTAEPDAEHQAEAGDRAGLPAGERQQVGDPAAQPLPDPVGAVDQPSCDQRVDRGERGNAGQRVAGLGLTVQEVGAGQVERPPYPFVDEHGG
jgi:hypothetical protein